MQHRGERGRGGGGERDAARPVQLEPLRRPQHLPTRQPIKYCGVRLVGKPDDITARAETPRARYAKTPCSRLNATSAHAWDPFQS